MYCIYINEVNLFILYDACELRSRNRTEQWAIKCSCMASSDFPVTSLLE